MTERLTGNEAMMPSVHGRQRGLKVLLVGWDGAAWARIHPLLDAGGMPHLARLIDRGVMGELAPLTPLCSPLLWTSVSTGFFADRHGVLDWVEDDPRTGGVRPATRASLAAPHVWELLAEQGLRCQSVGWPVTHPAAGSSTTGEAERSPVCVSDQYAVGSDGSVFPDELAAELLGLRFSAAEWSGADLQLFVPELTTIDLDRDRRPARLAEMLADAVSNHAAATALLKTDAWDLTAVWYGAAARASELFPADTDAVYAEVVPGVYRFLDLLLGRLVQLAGPDTVVMVVSDRAAAEAENSGEAKGVLCAAGPGVKVDELTYSAGVLDIAPTVIGLFGYTQPKEMAGHVIEEICAGTPGLTLPEPGGRTRAPEADEGGEIDPSELEALGYQDVVALSKGPEAERSRARRLLHLGCVLMAQERSPEAVPVLEAMTRRWPASAEGRMYLAQAYLLSGRVGEARELAEALVEEHPDSPLVGLARAHLAMAEGDWPAAARHLESSRGVHGLGAGLDAAVGEAYLRLGCWEEAAGAFESALRVDARMPGAHAGLARALLGAGRYEAAAGAALDAVRLRYDVASAHDALGRALLAMGRAQEAAGAFAARDRLRRVAKAR